LILREIHVCAERIGLLSHVFACHPDSGSLQEQQTLSALPKNFAGQNTAAEILTMPEVRSLRFEPGDDSLVVFSINPTAEG